MVFEYGPFRNQFLNQDRLHTLLQITLHSQVVGHSEKRIVPLPRYMLRKKYVGQNEPISTCE